MSKQNLFVGSLSYSTTDEGLKAFFETIGEVESARVIVDKFNNRSKGFGFVEFKDEADNQRAVDQLDGQELDGRTVKVSISKPREDRPRRDFGHRGDFRQRD